jgi:hypothetical protein
MIGGIILSVVPCLMFLISHFALKDMKHYEEKAKRMRSRPDISLAQKLKRNDKLKFYIPVAILWVIGLCFKWITGW